MLTGLTGTIGRGARLLRRGGPLGAALATLVAVPAPAGAEDLRMRAATAPPYGLELEPHLVSGLVNPPGPAEGQGAGVGLRGAFVVSREGFLPTPNDSLALGVGLDVLHYRGQPDAVSGSCVRREPGPGGTSVCTEVDVPGAPSNYLYIPVVAQWNVWPTPELSIYGEAGLSAFFASRGGGLSATVAVGGRFRVSDSFALALRLGWPTTTLGLAFFL